MNLNDKIQTITLLLSKRAFNKIKKDTGFGKVTATTLSKKKLVEFTKKEYDKINEDKELIFKELDFMEIYLGQLNLDLLIKILGEEDPNLVLPLGFNKPHSYRGHPSEVAFEPVSNIKIKEVLKEAKKALNYTFEGYKGGNYTMDKLSNCWFSYCGDCGETLGGFFLEILIQNAKVKAENK